MIGTGLARCASGTCPHATVPHPLAAGAGAVSLFVILKAFSSGASALTGVEAIANGVNAFKRPQSANAARTLFVLGAVAITLFLGVSWLAVHMHARPSSSASVLSQITRAAFPAGGATSFLYWVVQIFTFAILVLAANTSYQGFPRLAALLARDRFVARQFTNLGDRLVFSNGVVVLTGAAVALILIYHANVNSLIHLYVVGVFTAFTLSQAGMVRYWLRTRDPGWRYRGAINTLGAATTGVVAVVVIWSKFTEGAWLVIVAIPLLVLLFLGINRHYRRFARRLKAGVSAVQLAGTPTNKVLLWVESIDVATEGALWYARTIAKGQPIRALLAPGAHTDPGHPPALVGLRAGGAAARDAPDRRGPHAGGARRGLAAPARRVRLRHCRDPRAVQAAVAALRGRPHLVPAQGQAAVGAGSGGDGRAGRDEPARAGRKDADRIVVRVLLANVHAGSMRAISYARSLGIEDIRAVSFAFDEEEASAFPGASG